MLVVYWVGFGKWGGGYYYSCGLRHYTFCVYLNPWYSPNAPQCGTQNPLPGSWGGGCTIVYTPGGILPPVGGEESLLGGEIPFWGDFVGGIIYNPLTNGGVAGGVIIFHNYLPDGLRSLNFCGFLDKFNPSGGILYLR